MADLARRGVNAMTRDKPRLQLMTTYPEMRNSSEPAQVQSGVWGTRMQWSGPRGRVHLL